MINNKTHLYAILSGAILLMPNPALAETGQMLSDAAQIQSATTSKAKEEKFDAAITGKPVDYVAALYDYLRQNNPQDANLLASTPVQPISTDTKLLLTPNTAPQVKLNQQMIQTTQSPEKKTDEY